MFTKKIICIFTLYFITGSSNVYSVPLTKGNGGISGSKIDPLEKDDLNVEPEFKFEQEKDFPIHTTFLIKKPLITIEWLSDDKILTFITSNTMAKLEHELLGCSSFEVWNVNDGSCLTQKKFNEKHNKLRQKASCHHIVKNGFIEILDPNENKFIKKISMKTSHILGTKMIRANKKMYLLVTKRIKNIFDLVEVWDVETGTIKQCFMGKTKSMITFVAASPDFSYIITQAKIKDEIGSEIRFYSTKTGSCVGQVFLNIANIASIGLSPSNKFLALGSSDTFGNIIVLKTPQEIYKNNRYVYKKNKFFEKCENVEYWDFLAAINSFSFYQENPIQKEEKIKDDKDDKEFFESITHAEPEEKTDKDNKNNDTIIKGNGGISGSKIDPLDKKDEMVMFGAEKFPYTSEIKIKTPLVAIEWISDNKILAFIKAPETNNEKHELVNCSGAEVWNVEKKKQKTKIIFDYKKNNTRECLFRYHVIKKDVIEIWDPKQNTCITKLATKTAHICGTKMILFNKKLYLLVTKHFPQKRDFMELWDIETNKKQTFIGNKNNFIKFASFSPDFSYTITLAETQTKSVYEINFYNTKTGTHKYCVYLSLPDIKSIALSPSNKMLALMLNDDLGTIIFLKTPQELYASFSTTSGFLNENNNACESIEYWTFLFIISSFYQETNLSNGEVDIYEQNDLDFEHSNSEIFDDSMAINSTNIVGNEKKSVAFVNGRKKWQEDIYRGHFKS